MSRKVYTIDAEGKILGRLAAEVAFLLQGKNKPNYVPYFVEDKVIVKNISKIKVTGNKAEAKKYYRHSGYLGGIKETPYKKLFDSSPIELFQKTVYGMLPKNKLRSKMIKNLKIYIEEKK